MIDVVQKHFDELYEDKVCNSAGTVSSLDVVKSYIVLLENIVKLYVSEEELRKYLNQIVH